MFGNLVNNVQLRNLLENKHLEIEPFSPSDMSLAHYTLHVGRVKIRRADGSWTTTCDFQETANPFFVPANEYVIVNTRERLKLLSEHIVGTFSPASTLIEQGFGLVSGKIDKRYGTTGEAHGRSQELVVFGLKNYLNVSNPIVPLMRVAHVSFFDLRGVAGEKVELTQAEINQRVKRFLRAMDDGPFYDQDPSE